MAEIALITGASGGLGWEFARLCASAGYNCVLVARSADRLEQNAQSLREWYKIKALSIACDLSSRDSIDRIVAEVAACDVLINNAGFATNGRFDTLDEARLIEEMELDVVALTRLTRRYLPGMLERGRGRILNIASTAAFMPGPFMAVYYACKAYVLSFSQAISEEVRGSGVTVTCACPGATATGFQERANTSGTLLWRLPVGDARRVARSAFRGMMGGRDVVVPGLTNKLVAISPHITPRRALVWLSRKAVEPGH